MRAVSDRLSREDRDWPPLPGTSGERVGRRTEHKKRLAEAPEIGHEPKVTRQAADTTTVSVSTLPPDLRPLPPPMTSAGDYGAGYVPVSPRRPSQATPEGSVTSEVANADITNQTVRPPYRATRVAAQEKFRDEAVA